MSSSGGVFDSILLITWNVLSRLSGLLQAYCQVRRSHRFALDSVVESSSAGILIGGSARSERKQVCRVSRKLAVRRGSCILSTCWYVAIRASNHLILQIQPGKRSSESCWRGPLVVMPLLARAKEKRTRRLDSGLFKLTPSRRHSAPTCRHSCSSGLQRIPFSLVVGGSVAGLGIRSSIRRPSSCDD